MIAYQCWHHRLFFNACSIQAAKEGVMKVLQQMKVSQKSIPSRKQTECQQKGCTHLLIC